MQKIDAHQHFWKYDPVRDSWITNEMSAIRKDFLPEHLAPILQTNGIDGCIVIQSDQSEKENYFQLDNANKHSFIKAVVGWIDFQDNDLEHQLAGYKKFQKLKGFRHILQAEPQRDIMLTAKFKNGIALLTKYGFTYDVLIYPDQLPFVKTLVEEFPDQKFVIDHLAKPCIKFKKMKGWKDPVITLASYQNVWCKISGMVTEADVKQWKPEEFKPYMDVVVESFGTDRIMFGSDWPVCLLGASYEEVLNITRNYFSAFSSSEQDKFFGGNAMNFYNL
jgi:L-fuconolactonase